jgi:hypothetical protein
MVFLVFGVLSWGVIYSYLIACSLTGFHVLYKVNSNDLNME